MGHRYQKEEETSKIEFLDQKNFKFDWDNNKLDQSDNLIFGSMHVSAPTQFPEIELQNELVVPGLLVNILLKMVEQEIQGTVANVGYTNSPTNKSPYSLDVDNVIVINVDRDNNDDAIIVQECKLEDTSSDDMADTLNGDVAPDGIGNTTLGY